MKAHTQAPTYVWGGAQSCSNFMILTIFSHKGCSIRRTGCRMWHVMYNPCKRKSQYIIRMKKTYTGKPCLRVGMHIIYIYMAFFLLFVLIKPVPDHFAHPHTHEVPNLPKNDRFWGVCFSKMYFPRRALKRTPKNGVYGGFRG